MFEMPLTWSMEYIIKHMKLETDFINEAKNCEIAAKDIRNHIYEKHTLIQMDTLQVILNYRNTSIFLKYMESILQQEY